MLPGPLSLLFSCPLVLCGSVALWLSALVRLCFLSRSVAPVAPLRSHVSRRCSRPWHRWRTRSPEASAPSLARSLSAQCLCLRSPLSHARTLALAHGLLHLPKRAPAPRSSLLLSEGGSATGLAVKCCPPTPPGRTRLSRDFPVSGFSGISGTCLCSYHVHAERS